MLSGNGMANDLSDNLIFGWVPGQMERTGHPAQPRRLEKHASHRIRPRLDG